MIPRLRGLVAATLVSALLTLTPVAAGAQETGLALGTAAPSALVQTLDGRTVDLAALARGPAVVEFWATWCENCEALLPAMKRAAATYGTRVRFLSVAVNVNQSVQRVRLYAAKHGVPGVQLYDARGEATANWDVPATSYVVVLDRAGRVVYSGLGGDQNIEAAIRKVL